MRINLRINMLCAVVFFGACVANGDTIPFKNTAICEYSGSATHGSYPVRNAFNGNYSDRWLTESKLEVKYAQAEFNFGWRFKPTKLILTGLKDTSWSIRDPKQIILWAKNAADNEWDKLLDEDNISAWTESQKREWPLTATKAYSMFRLEIPKAQGTDQYRGLSEIEMECDSTATVLGSPSPIDGACHVTDRPTLKWGTSAAEEVSYRVYLGSDANLSEDNLLASSSEPQAILSEGTVLTKGTVYYWRVDTVFADESVLSGDVWSFAVFEPSDEPIAIDDFESYEVGALSGKGASEDGWTGSWTAASDTSQVVEESLVYRKGRIHISGGSKALRVSANSDTALMRTFERHQDSPMYMGFLVRPEVAAGGKMLGMYLNGNSGRTNTGTLGTDVCWSSGKPTATIYAGNTNPVRDAFNNDFAIGETHFIIVKLVASGYDDKNVNTYSSSHLYVDPSTLDEPASSDARAYTGLSRNDYFDKFIMRLYNIASGEFFYVDELRIGSTWRSVIPDPPKGLTIFIR